MPKILRVGYRVNISWQDWDVLISIGGMWDNFKIDGRMRNLNSWLPFENLTRWDWDKDSESGRMKPKLVAGCGF